MKKILKRMIPFILVAVLCFNMSGTAFAATDSEDSTNMLIGTYTMPADLCKTIYDQYVEFYGQYSNFTMALTDIIHDSGYYTVYVATSIASSLGSIYTGYVMDATYDGWQSGRGATLYVYDNTTPIILAN